METVAFERFRKAFLAGDAGEVAAAFTADAAYATNAGVLLRGRELINAIAIYRRDDDGTWLIESLVVNKRA